MELDLSFIYIFITQLLLLCFFSISHFLLLGAPDNKWQSGIEFNNFVYFPFAQIFQRMDVYTHVHVLMYTQAHVHLHTHARMLTNKQVQVHRSRA